MSHSSGASEETGHPDLEDLVTPYQDGPASHRAKPRKRAGQAVGKPAVGPRFPHYKALKCFTAKCAGRLCGAHIYLPCKTNIVDTLAKESIACATCHKATEA